MGKYKDIKIGDQFGRWTVIEKGKLVKKKNGSRQYWVCQCSCESKTIREVDGYGLLNGSSQSCGCIIKDKLKGGTPHNKIRKDIEIGDVFGKWTVIGTSDKQSKRGVKYWNCECSCDKHTIKAVNEESLKIGQSKSCGCIQKEKIRQLGLDSAKDISGNKYGKLTAIRFSGVIKNKRRFWYCDCDCGNKDVLVQIDALTTGKTKSCGCLGKNDLTGKKFGKFLVIEKDDYWTKQYGCTTYKCQCECGEIRYERSSSLVTGSVKSCGCIAKEVENLVGQKFGELTVIKYIGKKRYEDYNTSSNLWECECSCGNICVVTQGNLKSGGTQSCGCLIRSHGEIAVSKLLTKWKFNFEEQYRFNDCKYKNTLPFDFVLLNNKNEIYVAIEFDGEFHFKPIRLSHMTQKQADENFELTKIRDEIKNTYCNQHNIPLIRIPYWILKEMSLEDFLFDKMVELNILEEIKSA